MKEMNAVRFVTVALAICLLLYVGVVFTASSLGPETLTANTIAVMSRNIRDYFKANGRIPQSLDELQSLTPTEPPVDAWGRRIIYIRKGEDDFTLRSLGKDGRVGGMDDDRDLEVECRFDEHGDMICSDDWQQNK